MIRATISIIATLLICSGSLAHAAEPSSDDVARAERLYKEGLTAFDEGAYERAAMLFEASWAIVPKPELLYNEAVAWGRHGDFERAREIGARAERAGLPEQMHTRNAARLHAWDIRAQTRRLAEESAARDAAEREPPPPPASGASARSRIGMLTASVGATALLSSGIVELLLVGVGGELGEAGDRATYDKTLRRGRDLQLAGKVLSVAGAALTLAGVVVWLWPDGNSTIGVTIGAGDVAISLQW